ncbi:serine/threonine-protein kinase [Pseudomonas sp. OTU750018]|uniref:serine/threonine-protein kinase n=1 Tax=Pseudomonas sp. OTU750018 TaxID=2709708 RepID=UPI00141D7E90|nr:serine/threonine-protein kinase [Pseudomonas sp. OTU750018]
MINLPDRYSVITNTLMSGGFGSVQPVRDNFLGRDVLFKFMRSGNDDDQLRNEIQMLAKARSKHIVEIYDVIKGEAGEVQGIIIEHLKGRSFEDFHLEAIGDPTGYLKILYQIAQAITALHAADIIHRDLKLDNIKTSSAGVVKLFDFGISVEGEDYHTRLNRGTLVYAAPELFVPDACITKEMDIYALGVCAWALASASTPSVLFERPPQTSARVPSIDTVMGGKLAKEVVDLIDACLSTNPAQRPTAKTVCDTIQNHLVRDEHRGTFVYNDKLYTLSKDNRQVALKFPGIGGIGAVYDGVRFQITSVQGDVYINNSAAVVGSILHDACVLTFGRAELKSHRYWVTFSSSHPEVIL